MKLRDLINESTNQTTGRKSKEPTWITKDGLLNELIRKLSFPVKAFVDVSYGDVFIYVNPKNRKALDEYFESLGYKFHSISGTSGYYENPKFEHIFTGGSNKGGLYQVKVKNKLDVPQQ